MATGIDIGGTRTRIGTSEQPDRDSFPVTDKPGPTLAKIINRLRDPDRIGLALPGVINKEARRIEQSANLPYWEGQPIARRLEEETGATVTILNDMTAGAIGAARKENESFLYLVWGTGFGAVLVQKHPLRVAQIELGHHSIDPDGPLCPCGQRGCVTAYVAGGHAKKQYGVELKDAGDETLDTVADRAAQALTNAAVLFGVRRIVANGGVVQGNDDLYERTRTKLQERVSLADPPTFERTGVIQPGIQGALRVAERDEPLDFPTLRPEL